MIGKILLLPFSVIYGIITGIRNSLFNCGILKSKSFSIPVICVGNITVGGTGKTPHTEFLISALKKEFKIACLSRGYKRHTSGFVLAEEHSTARDIGDEPMQIKKKFPDITVACDTKRVRGIEQLLALPQRLDVVILDDAFQHRYVKADINIVLIDYHRPVDKDYLLPAGRLRESWSSLKRADYIIVTKCPADITPIDQRIILKNLKIKPYQKLFFTMMQYGQAKGIVPGNTPLRIGKDAEILCVTGIARPESYVKYLERYTEHISELRFPDHHHFSKRNIQEIERTFKGLHSKEKYLFTTEKDAMRFALCNLSTDLKKRMFYIPIEPVFINSKERLINELREYVSKYKR